MTDRLARWTCLALLLAGLAHPAGAADAAHPGRSAYEARCRTCHGGSARADVQLGPSLAGLIGARAASQDSGVHSRAMAESAIVWDRESLRSFLSDPQRAVPGTLMSVAVTDRDELERLLDYLESLK